MQNILIFRGLYYFFQKKNQKNSKFFLRLGSKLPKKNMICYSDTPKNAQCINCKSCKI